MKIMNYKNLDKGYYSGLSISREEKNGYISYLWEDGFGECNYLMPDNDFDGRIESEEQIREYIRNYYVSVLSKLDARETYEELYYNTLVTFDDGEFSHGNIISAWIELFLDIKVPIIKREMLDKGLYKYVEIDNFDWVMDILEEEIKKTISDMRGFNSVRALYLFMRSEELEKIADVEEERSLITLGLSSSEHKAFIDRISNYRKNASFCRMNANLIEDAWIERKSMSKKKEKCLY